MRQGKGSHTNWYHPRAGGRVTLSGHDKDDADHYQEDEVRAMLERIRDAEATDTETEKGQ
jgi:predicted RNA binding protein YcfA (HicA-like mRNA interferase family)